MIHAQLRPGNSYELRDLEAAFSVQFGAALPSINVRRNYLNVPYIVLLKKEPNPCVPASLDYHVLKGEGKGAEQRASPGNKSLMRADAERRPVFLFEWQEEHKSWLYAGLVKLVSADYRLDKGRKTYFFTLKLQNIRDFLKPEVHFLNERLKKKPDVVLPEWNRKVKPLEKFRLDLAFEFLTLLQYNATCAVSGSKRKNKREIPEAEVVSFSPLLRWRDYDLRNAMPLTKFLAWAFESGWFSLTERGETDVFSGLFDSPEYSALTDLESKPILVPADARFQPHKFYIRKHRVRHGFRLD